MNKQILQMKYHPAKKVIEFAWENHGKLDRIDVNSKLAQYINKHIPFVLQDHGKDFFTAIVSAYSGELTAPLHVVAPKSDYEDFRYMIDFYNNNEASTVKISATLIDELPDMQAAFQAVKEHGESAIAIFRKHQIVFEETKNGCKFEKVKEYMASFIRIAKEESNNINEKIHVLDSDTVNLCFTSVTSAGKSTLINAVLGYKILPEAMKPETAKMFCIKSPAENESVRIRFKTASEFSEIIWNNDDDCFMFATRGKETDIREKIQTALNECTQKGDKQHRQMYVILDELNKSEVVEPKIEVFFPVPLDMRTNGLLKYAIYDTPGADSNNDEHIRVLKDALSAQSHSILVFVVEPGAQEGGGNASLLEYLRKAESENTMTSIDVSRSIFVANFADKLRQKSQFEDIRDAVITNKQYEDFSIKLSDKKLFFTSAMWAYSARAAKERPDESPKEVKIIKQDYERLTDFEDGKVYRFNRYANSESATRSMVSRSEVEFKCASDKGDREQVALVCSGLFALEEEIILYGEKYASAVRAYAIIDSVEKALLRVKMSADALDKVNASTLEEVKNEIATVRDSLSSAINSAHQKYAISKKKLDDALLRDLLIDGAMISSHFKKPVRNKLDKFLWRIFSFLRPARKGDKDKIANIIKQVHKDYVGDYNTERKKRIEQTRNDFLHDIKNALIKEGNISDEARAILFDNVGSSPIAPYVDTERFNFLYDEALDKGWFNLEFVDRSEFLNSVDDELSRISDKMSDDFQEEYTKTLDDTLKTVKDEFSDNLDKYSLLLNAKLEDRDTLDSFREKISKLADDLSNCQRELNRRIWGGI